MDTKIRYNIPRDLLEYELYENKKKQDLYGEEAISLVNIIGSTDKKINKKFVSKLSFLHDIKEYYEYEQNKLKKI
jgi:hypothetical protein